MKQTLTLTKSIRLLLIVLFTTALMAGSKVTTAQPAAIITGICGNPAGTDSAFEYVQFLALQNINFSTTHYCVVWANNGAATANGWIQGGTTTYGFNLTSGSVSQGQTFYVGGTGTRSLAGGHEINGPNTLNIDAQNWIRSINVCLTAGDGFGSAVATGGILGNSGTSNDAAAIFSVDISLLTATTVPMDAIFYGTAIGTAKSPTNSSTGYTMPNSDLYQTAQGTYGYGTNTYAAPDNSGAGDYLKASAGIYNTVCHSWDQPRTFVQVVNPTTIAAITPGITLVTSSNPLPVVLSTTPSSAPAGGSGFTLTVTGSGFVSCAGTQVYWNGSPRTTTFVNSTTLTATISSADIASIGSAIITVSNPTPGGGNSNTSATFNITGPTITLSTPTLSGFSYALSSGTGGPSANQSFTVSGANLTNPISLSGTSHFEISYSAGSGYTNGTLSPALTPAGGNVAATTIFVRLSATPPVGGGFYVDTVKATSTGASSQPVTCTGQVFSGNFTQGNVAVEVLGAVSTTSGNPVSVYEYSPIGGTPSGKLVNIYNFPSTGGGNKLTDISTSVNGYLKTSSDGSMLLVPGYNAAVSVTEPTSTFGSATGDVLGRELGILRQGGTISLPNPNLNAGMPYAFRGVTSNGFSFWIGGTSSDGTSNGNSLVYLKDSTATPIVNLSSTTMRGIGIGAGNLYYLAAGTNGATGLFQVSSNGLPIATPASAPVNVLADGVYNVTATSASPTDFTMNPAGTILYVADNNAFVSNTTEKGGVLRFNNVSGTWTYQYTIKTSGGAGPIGVTADWSGANPIVYISTGSTLEQATDAGNGNVVTIVGSVIATPTSPAVFRGVTMAPVANASPSLFCTATQLIFPGTVPTLTSPEQSFNVSGYNLGAHNVTVTAPTGYIISTTSGSESSSPIILTPSASGIVNATIFMEFHPATAGSYSSIPPFATNPSTYLQLTDAGAGATAIGVPITGTSANTLNYYNVANSDLTQVTNWGTNTNGTGANPVNFTSSGQIFNIVNGNTATLTSAWTVSGTLSKVVVGNGSSAINFTIPATHSYTGTVDVQANGTLTIANLTQPTLGILNLTSTVVYSYDGAFTVPNDAYGNLSLVGPTNPATDVYTFNKTVGSALTVNGNFSVSNAAVLGNNQSPFTTMILAGNFTASNGATFGYAPPAQYPSQTQALFSVTTGTTGNQTITYSGGKIILATITSSKTAGTFTLGTNTTLIQTLPSNFTYSGTASFVSNSGSSFNASGTAVTTLTFTGTSIFSLGGSINNGDSTAPKFTVSPTANSCSLVCNFGSGTTFSDGGHTINLGYDLFMKGSGIYNLTGTVIAGANAYFASDATTTSQIVAPLNNLTISAGTARFWPTGGATITIKGSLTINGTGVLNLDGNTLNLAGNYNDSRTVDAITNNVANVFVFNGTAAQTFTNAYAAGESFNNVTVNNSQGVNFTGGASIDVITPGVITLTSGIMNTSTGKVILGVASTISETTSSYVVGTVTSTRTLATGTNQTYGGMGIEVDALGSAPGSTVATRVIGVSSPLGCTSSSILRKFTLAPATNTGLNATVVLHYFSSLYELNGFIASDLTLFESTNGGSSWTNLASTGNTGLSTITITGLNALGLITAGTPQPTGGLVTPTNSIVCSGNSVTLTANGATGDLIWQSSTDNINWSNIPGATNATYAASPSVETFYRLIASYPGCLVVSSTTGIVDISNPIITVTSTSVTDNSMTLSWSPVGTGNYAVSYSGPTSATLTSVTPPKTITGLTAGGAYNVTVTQTGASLVGCPAGGTLNGVNTLCGMPTGVTLSSPANGQILASWTGVPGADYRVYYRPLFSYNTFFTKDVSNVSSVLITKQGNNNLYASTTYEVYVSRLDCPTTGAVGQPTNPINVTTLPALSCSTPVIDSVRSLCPVQIEVFLHPGSSPTGNYNIYIQRITPTVLAVNSYGVSGNYFTINTPYSGDQYLIAAESKCSGGALSALYVWPGNFTIKPLCSSPANLVISNPTCHGFTASWNADQCISNSASEYEISLRVAGTINYNSYGVSLPANGNSPYDVISFLTSGRSYQAFVRSVYSCNGFVTYGPSSQVLTTTTLSSGCRDEEDAPVTEQAPAVQQTSQDNSEVLSLYPNPNNGQFKINLSSLNTDDRQVRVEVMNMLGQTVLTHFAMIEGGLYNEYVQLPSGISSGTYIVRVTVGKNAYTSKINVSK